MMGKSIGIDLGTTNSVVAYYDGTRSRVLRTRDELLTPSVVSYSARSRRKENLGGMLVVGKAAVANALIAPEHTIFSIKRLMGRTIDEEKVQEACKQFGYNLVPLLENPDQSIRIKLHDKEYTPVEISAMILAQLKEDAEKALATEITYAVITVPAYFEERQRAATREAGQRAGLIVKQIIDEPTAAAVAFGFERGQEKHRVLVYDLGGGTFDVSLVQMKGQKFQGLTIEGDMWLGGDDFDYRIIQAIKAEVLDELKSRGEDEGVDLSRDKRFLAQAKQKAEEAKIALSGRTEYQIVCPAILRSPIVDLEMTITREEFSDWIRPQVEHSMELVRQALARNSLTPEQISTVLMVGGATATPLVYEAVTKLFGKEKVHRDIDPMHCVAIGASIVATRLDSIECPTCQEMSSEKATICSNCGTLLADKRVTVDSVTARSLGIGVIKDGKPDSYAHIIPKDTRYPLPKAMERTFLAGAKDTIKLSIYEGEEATASLNERQGDIEYALPQEIPVGTPVRIGFDFDKDRLLKVTIHIENYPHLTKAVTLDRRGPLGPAKKPRKERSWRADVQKSVSLSRNFLSDFRDFVDPGQAAKMETDVQKAEELSRGENEVEAERVMRALDAILFNTSGTASLLFLAEMAINRIEDPRLENQVRVLIRDLRNAARQNNQAKIKELSQSLRIALRVTRSFIERTGPLPVEDQKWYGTLTDM